MYLSTTRAADRPPGGRVAANPGPGKVSGTVVALGIVSLLTDASAEMVTAILPMYLMYGLGLGLWQVGLLDGLYTGATALLRLGGGYVADRFSSPKAVAVAGYGLSAATKLAFPLVGASLAGIGAVVGADRAGKGIRTAPRDALIVASSRTAGLGRAFGVHRTLDTAGALLGPLLAFGLLAAIAGGYDTVFVGSFCLATAGVVVLVMFVRAPAPAPRPQRSTLRAGLAAVADPKLRRVCVATCLLGLVTVGDMLLYVTVQRRFALPAAALPLLPLGTAVTFMLAATPAGRLADRVGRWRLFLGGHVLLLGAYLALLGPGRGWPYAVVVLALHGLFYAATDGVLMAHAGPLIPEPVRTTGLAVVQTGQALARAGGAVLFGVLAQASVPAAMFGGAAAVLGAAVCAAAWLHRPGGTT